MPMTYCKKFIGIKVGDTFSSYDEVKEKIHWVQEKSQVPLLLRDCVTLHGAVKRRPNIAVLANPALVYHSLHYICVCGRRDSQRTRTYIRLGISPEYLSADKEKCGVEIKFGLSKDYQQLEVKRIVDMHNHKISQKLYKVILLSKIGSVPQINFESDTTEAKSWGYTVNSASVNSRFEGDIFEDGDNDIKQNFSAKNSSLKSNKRKRLDDDDDCETSLNIVKIQGVQNKGKIKGRRIAFKHLLEEMYSAKNANCEVFEKGMKPMALYFQTEEMEKSFAAYPEVLIIDSSNTISALRIKVYTLLNADGNGRCTIVGFCFAMEDHTSIISFLLETFMKFNLRCTQTKSIMLDHPLYSKHLNAIMCHFTSATFFMCYHFSVKAYQAKTMRNPGVAFQNIHERDVCSKLFKEMALAKNEKAYYEYYHRFKLYCPQSLFQYFVVNWHRRKEQWVDCMKDSNSSFLDQRHSGIETIDCKVAELCNSYTSVQTFFRELLSMLASLRLQRKKKALEMPVKGPIVTPAFQIAEIQYQNFLTPYAFSMVKMQIQSSFGVKILDNDDGDQIDQYTVVSPRYGEILCTSVSCPCMMFTVIGLPCCHIFSIRNERGTHAFDKSLCNVRWSLQYLRRSLDLEIEDMGIVQDAEFGVAVLPEYAERNHSVTAAIAGQCTSANRRGNTAFVQSSVQPSTDGLDVDGYNPFDECVEEIVIDEVDPDGDVNLFGDTEDASGNSTETLDWAEMLGTL